MNCDLVNENIIENKYLINSQAQQLVDHDNDHDNDNDHNHGP